MSDIFPTEAKYVLGCFSLLGIMALIGLGIVIGKII